MMGRLSNLISRFYGRLKKNIHKVKFRRKLVITYVIIMLIPLLSFGYFAYKISNDLLNRQLNELLNASNRQLSYFLSNRLEKNDEFIRFTAFSPYLMEDFNGEPKDWYSISRKINNYFEPVAWYNLNRNSDFSELKIYFEYLDVPIGTFILPGQEVKDQQWYQETCEASNTSWYFEDGDLYASRRIWNAPLDMLLGAVRVKVDFNQIFDSLLATQQNGYGAILVDENGEILYAADTDDKMDEEDLQLLIENAGASVNVNENQYYVTSQAVPNHNWSLYSYAAIDTFTSQRQQIIYIVFLIAGSCLLLLFGLIGFFTRRMVKRLELLNDQMSRVTGLASQNAAPLVVRDEMDMLTESFGRLVDQVHQSELIQKEEELKTLQAQISPHFLYNTLSLIKWKAIENDDGTLADITGFISTFYRTCLNKGRSLVIIRDEIDNIKSYINLQLIMHNHDFQVEYDIDEEIYDCSIVNFTLQPLVENAILHGLDESEKTNRQLLIRGIFSDVDKITFSIQDNGIGINEELLKGIFDMDSSSYGIQNVNKRIKLYFGDAFGICITSVLGEGTTVKLSIPRQ